MNFKLMILSLFSFLTVQVVTVNALTISFIPNNVTIHEDDIITIEYNVTDFNATEDEEEFIIDTEDENIVSIERDVILSHPQLNLRGLFNVTGKFLGKTTVICKNVKTNLRANGDLSVIVIRKNRIIDTVFTVSVAIFVSIIYINLGCAINWSEIPTILKKPIGPSIGFCGQFILMPLLSYGLGLILFPDNPEMQLGLFFSGVAPPGGSSNIWAVLLEGNLSLSILMTTTSTVASFATMPLWIFTLGKVIFDKGNLEVPYTQITTYVLALVIPLAIGFFIQRKYKRFADFMKQILKGLSIVLLLFIIIFASVTNIYLFKLFSWKIIVASMALPWLAYVLGYFTAYLFGQPYSNSITIAMKIGIQNTGIPIFLLRFALPQPEADLITIVPVSVSVFTPIPLICLFICLKVWTRLSQKKRELKSNTGIDNLATCT
ncbi:ileal sodium/bile acid cotransporter-like [Anoplophora glabripennis]|uniref:ileal sodium/bile acid cotransporter-like n=1 Tax=Anoplophora glabripennis TaxID=217634 RepID=UPI0008757A0E|nr:ileal sodium/bile acid cotransporter-like [Anoplophora glabripennis]